MKIPFKLTSEQNLIVHSKVDVLLVQAFAGTGKTSTLVELACANPGLKILYLAFGKAVQTAASMRFPSNVTCKTNHALAWSRFGAAYKSAGKLGSVSPRDLIRVFDLVPNEARQVQVALERFIQSADAVPSDVHVAADIVGKAHRAKVEAFASKAWATMKNKEDPSLKMTHDGYFKLFQMSKPDLALDYDLILGDEWQDTNPVTHALVSAQSCRLIFVGDTHQSIYAFRGATDAMRQVEVDFSNSARSFQVLRLTHSFRFGKGIADLATSMLSSIKGERHALVGRGGAESAWSVDRDQPYAVIARSNGTLFAETVAILGRQSFHLVGLEEVKATGEAIYAPFEKLVDVHHLMTGDHELVKDPFIKAFKSAGRLEQYASDVDDKELLMQMKISKDFGASVPALVARISAEVTRDSAAAHVKLMTAHRSKGLEFDQVVLAGDFEEFVDEDGKLVLASTQDLAQELNLLYVGATRALVALQTNPQIRELLEVLKNGGFILPKDEVVTMVAIEDVPAAATGSRCDPCSATEACTEAAEAAGCVRVTQLRDLALMGKLNIPRDFHKRALKDQVAHAILVEGILDLGELAVFLARTHEDTVRVLGNLVAARQLSVHLFSQEPAVALAARGIEEAGRRPAVSDHAFL